MAHEALEAYHSLNRGIEMDYKANHAFANIYFGDVKNGPPNLVYRNLGEAPYYTQTWDFQRINSTVEVKTVVHDLTAPADPYLPGTMVEVRHLP